MYPIWLVEWARELVAVESLARSRVTPTLRRVKPVRVGGLGAPIPIFLVLILVRSKFPEQQQLLSCFCIGQNSRLYVRLPQLGLYLGR